MSALLSALRSSQQESSDATSQLLSSKRVVIAGSGSAGLGVANAIAHAMVIESHEAGGESPLLTVEEARRNIIVVDKDGVLDDHKAEELTAEQCQFARGDGLAGLSLRDVIAEAKPDILLGLTACPALFNEEIIRLMASAADER